MAGHTYGITIADSTGFRTCELFSPSGEEQFRLHRLPLQGVNNETEKSIGESIQTAFFTEEIRSNREGSSLRSCSKGYDAVVTYDNANKTFYALYAPKLASAGKECVFRPVSYVHSDGADYSRSNAVFNAGRHEENPGTETQRIEMPGTVMMAYTSGCMCETNESIVGERENTAIGSLIGLVAGGLIIGGITKSALGGAIGAFIGAIAGFPIGSIAHDPVFQSPDDSLIRAFFNEEAEGK